jgi:hypothetical protein
MLITRRSGMRHHFIAAHPLGIIDGLTHWLDADHARVFRRRFNLRRRWGRWGRHPGTGSAVGRGVTVASGQADRQRRRDGRIE